MIIDFQFGNFRSFQDLQTFTMRAAIKRKNDSGMDEANVYESTIGIRMLKTKAIYGSNASGKSNIAKAFGAFTKMVKSSVVDETLTRKIWSDRFRLNKNNETSQMSFQLIFTHEKKLFRYGFQIQNAVINTEWLFSAALDDLNKEELYFMREKLGLHYNDLHIPNNSTTPEYQENNNEIFRKDSLFLTSAAIMGNQKLASIRDVITKVMAIDGTNSDTGLQLAVQILDKGTAKEKKALKDFLRYADTGIYDLTLADFPITSEQRKDLPEEIAQNKNFKRLISSHIVYDEHNKALKKLETGSFYQWESNGSIKLLGLAAIILRALKKGASILIDEFDAGLHPNLALKILNFFNSNETNPNHAQLIIITHDESLMKRAKLRRDQIVFVDKNNFGNSSMKVLIEYKGIRKDHSFDKEYLEGSYAGVPNLVKLDSALLDYLK